MIQLSVIIPHYNSPTLLSKLLESIPNRDDIEAVVVDDNSDLDLEIYDHCKDRNKDRNVIFLNNSKDLKGAGNARNLGISNASGKWLLFADADDYFMAGAFDIFEKYYDCSSDIIYFEPTSVELGTQKESDRHSHYSKLLREYLAHPDAETELSLKYKWWSPCCKMILKDVVDRNNIKFEGTLYSNDVMFSTILGFNAKKISASDNIIYCITKSSDSLTAKVDEKAMNIRQQVAIRRLGFLISHLSIKDMKMLGYRWTDYVYYYISKLKGFK